MRQRTRSSTPMISGLRVRQPIILAGLLVAHQTVAIGQPCTGLPFSEASQKESEEQVQHQMHVHEGENLADRKRLQASLVQQLAEDPSLDKLIKLDLMIYRRARKIFDAQKHAFETKSALEPADLTSPRPADHTRTKQTLLEGSMQQAPLRGTKHPATPTVADAVPAKAQSGKLNAPRPSKSKAPSLETVKTDDDVAAASRQSSAESKLLSAAQLDAEEAEAARLSEEAFQKHSAM